MCRPGSGRDRYLLAIETQAGNAEVHRSIIMSVPALENSTAEVAELADALASGASGSNPIGVQIPASAPTFAHESSRRLSAVALAKADLALAQ